MLLVPLPDYERIFRVMYSVLGPAYTHRSCIFFAHVGALILRHHYRLQAFAVAGAAAYTLQDDTDRLVTARFGNDDNGRLVHSGENFHCWIECNGFIVDFMAPVFQESLLAAGIACTVPRRMFQRRRIHMAASLDDTKRGPAGAFHVQRNAELTTTRNSSFGHNELESGLASVCLHWFKRPPKRIEAALRVVNEHGDAQILQLHGPAIVGAW